MSEENKRNIDRRESYTSYSNINVVIVVDKDKLPEELRDKLPQDLQSKLIELLQEKTNSQQDPLQNVSQRDDQQKYKQSGNLFAVQRGAVVGNIYKQ
jgi:cation transport regulator ChaB